MSVRDGKVDGTWSCVVCGQPVKVNAKDWPGGEGDVAGGFVHFACREAGSR